jgi:hypothetical protein
MHQEVPGVHAGSAVRIGAVSDQDGDHGETAGPRCPDEAAEQILVPGPDQALDFGYIGGRCGVLQRRARPGHAAGQEDRGSEHGDNGFHTCLQCQLLSILHVKFVSRT